MEHNTKNFDRNIEQMMNEHQVAPPFGAWNRISAELDAMPAIAAGAAPVVTSLIPKRAMLGIIAAALVIGASVLTGYLASSSQNNNVVNADAKTTVAATTKTTSKPIAAQQTVGVKNSVTPEIALTKVKVKHIAATTPVQSTILAAQQVQPTVNEPVAVTASPIINNQNTDVPTPLEPVSQNAQETQTYYFPAIDVNTPEKAPAPVKTITNKAHIGDAASVSPNNDDDKPKHKRFHPARKRDWGYMNINR